MEDRERVLRWENRSEIPMFVLGLVYLAAYAVHVLATALPRAAHEALLAVIGAAWAGFLLDYVVRVRLSGRRFGVRYVATHLLDTVVLLLPLLRPLRAVEIYQVIQRRREHPRMSLYGRVIAYAGMTALLLGFSGALAVYQQERGAPHATILTFGDAIWWVCETLTTVGYGDVTPVTVGGRVIAAFLMAVGLALLGAVTGSFSSWLYQVFAREGELPPGR